MTPFTKRTLAVCGITVAVETVLLLTMADPILLLFVLGPMVFLAIIAWRRRTHLDRGRRLAGVAIGTGAFGIAALAVGSLQFRNHPDQPNIVPLAAPLAQWLAVLFVWLAISREESREKRAKPPASP